MGKFSMDGEKSQEAVEKATKKGGGYAGFKITKETTKLLILGVVEGKSDSVVFTVTKHEVWGNSKLFGRCGSPSVDGETDKIADMGWKLRDKYAESSNTKKKDLWKKFALQRPSFVNIINLDDVGAGPQVFQMSNSIAETVMEEIKDTVKEEGNLSSICDLDEGRILIIKSNMKPKLQRRYKVKFSSKTANLSDHKEFTDEMEAEWVEKMFDLTKLQPKLVEDEFEAHFEKLKKAASKLGVDIDDFYDDDDTELEEDEEEVEDDDGFDNEIEDDDIDVDDDTEDFDDDGFDDEEPKKEPKKSKKKSKKRRKK